VGKGHDQVVQPQGVVFDWGGTLAKFAAIELADMWRLAAHHLDPVREDELTEQLCQAEARMWARVSSTQESATLAELIAEASVAVGLDVGEAVMEEAAVRHLDAWTNHIRHDPDAGPVLDAIRERGLATALLSNTHWPRAFHERFLERDGLAHRLDARLYTSELSHLKPHPSVFRAALAAIGIDDPAAAVFVGDRPVDDVGGAKALGMRAVLRPNPLLPAADQVGPAEPDASITTLPELLPLLDAWSRA
jgi:putative hydrolase of the HAD superfamily